MPHLMCTKDRKRSKADQWWPRRFPSGPWRFTRRLWASTPSLRNWLKALPVFCWGTSVSSCQNSVNWWLFVYRNAGGSIKHEALCTRADLGPSRTITPEGPAQLPKMLCFFIFFQMKWPASSLSMIGNPCSRSPSSKHRKSTEILEAIGGTGKSSNRMGTFS